MKAPLFRVIVDDNKVRIWKLTKIVDNGERHKSHTI